MSDAFIEAHRDRRPVRLRCAAVGVSPGGCYGWPRRPPSARPQRRDASVAAITAAQAEVKARYGGPRPHAELAARGEPRCVSTVAGLMRRHGVAAEAGRKSRSTTDSDHGRPVAEDVLGRQFEPAAANRAWAAEITSIPTGEGRLDLAAVEGLHARRIVGRSTAERIASRLVVDALEMAAARRPPGAGPVAHSDRGSRSAGAHDQRLPASHGITWSMGRRGDRRDHAPMGSFFASPETELVHDADFTTRSQARAAVFESIAVFDDRVRRHWAPGSLPPDEYERAA